MTSMHQLVKRAIGEYPSDTEMFYAKVMTTSPLRIQMLDDSRVEISLNIVLSDHFKDLEISIPCSCSDHSGTAAGTIVRHLEVGERVYGVYDSRLQKFFVIDRVGLEV